MKQTLYRKDEDDDDDASEQTINDTVDDKVLNQEKTNKKTFTKLK